MVKDWIDGDVEAERVEYDGHWIKVRAVKVDGGYTATAKIYKGGVEGRRHAEPIGEVQSTKPTAQAAIEDAKLKARKFVNNFRTPDMGVRIYAPPGA